MPSKQLWVSKSSINSIFISNISSAFSGEIPILICRIHASRLQNENCHIKVSQLTWKHIFYQRNSSANDRLQLLYFRIIQFHFNEECWQTNWLKIVIDVGGGVSLPTKSCIFCETRFSMKCVIHLCNRNITWFDGIKNTSAVDSIETGEEQHPQKNPTNGHYYRWEKVDNHQQSMTQSILSFPLTI